ncbi:MULTISPECIES: hypothetical protein [Methylobacterium]|uniref:Uncharacterized protein n=1 Tax=Methylobacterium jeotgali TaxID=381630 RepID=A0ABQ4T146_9HYPH|nr:MULTISPECIES: hypothetical protein [Methylobacterium]PIU06601.1 MAG: hypothetical protein COT56_09010 [Methylobacterium sp. CG09_land_8_20_14_0_10_71_15]PIU12592.1 MAG: hypothetical protein COT28_14450 [Methylobacterium sp. CG08_land_8_20_14_0_20_71_15]GBU19475.1 hypothetical protein AwMethylo_36900 [Methylobacterium sp.]GJE08782.1 hypothetical protein AOPFMNJM_4128 [Methylobacterium jeotgali]
MSVRLDWDADQIVFAPLPAASVRVAAPAVERIAPAVPAPSRLLPALVPWIAAQAVATLIVATGIAQAMPPRMAQAEMAGLDFQLRLSEPVMPAAPLPAAVADGFSLRLSSHP